MNHSGRGLACHTIVKAKDPELVGTMSSLLGGGWHVEFWKNNPMQLHATSDGKP
jgi:hypothetical protein